MNRWYPIFLCLGWLHAGVGQAEFEPLRERMVRRQLRDRDIHNKEVLQAMGDVPRHLFVPEQYHSRAYEDRPLPIGEGQTISQPYMVAYMTQVIRPEPGDKVLEIGTGSGYQAAILAELVQEVYSIEIVESLGSQASDRLKSLGYTNVRIRVGDGYHGWPEEAPFDAIVVTAGAEEIPLPLIDQLADGGRLVIPVGPHSGVRELLLLTKKEGKVRTESLMSVRFVPFTREGG